MIEPRQQIGGLILGTFRRSVAAANTGRPDFLEWINERGWITAPKATDAAQRVIPFKLWPDQETMARWLIAGYDLSINKTLDKAREVGATWLAMHAVYYLLKFEYRFSALMVSRKDELVDDGTEESLFGKVRFIHSMQPVGEQPTLLDSHRRIRCPDTGGLLKGESTNVALGRSTRYAVVVTDEWAFVDRTKTKRIKVSLETVSRSWWRISTHAGRGTEFHKACRVAQAQSLDVPLEEQAYMRRDWRTNPGHDDDWHSGLLIENGGELTYDERAQEHDCDPAGVSGTRVWHMDRGAVEYTDADLPENVKRDWTWVGMMDFGSGPAWSVFSVCLMDYRSRRKPHFWFDLCLPFQGVTHQDIAADIKAHALGVYAQRRMISGDPAGRARESDQESWESNLQADGVPIRCLPAVYNTKHVIDLGMLDFQKLLDQGRIHIHVERAITLLEAIESWEWQIPDGIDIEMVSREHLSPKKDWASHPCETMRYTTSAVLRKLPRMRAVSDKAKMAPSLPGAAIDQMFDRAIHGQNGGRLAR